MLNKKSSRGWFLLPIKGFIARLILSIFYAMPQVLLRPLAVMVSRLSAKISAKKQLIIETNLSIAFPQLSREERQELMQKNLRHSGLLLAEFPLAWLASKQKILEKIAQVEGRLILDQLVEVKKPVIVVMPHIGNWEFLVQWIQINYSMIGFYKPSKLPQVDQLIYHARSQFGGQPFPATNKGVLGLMRQLKKGNVMVILPDQVPQLGAGCFADFYNKPAYTMTLLHKITQKTQAELVFARSERRSDYRFNIYLETANFNAIENDVEKFNQQMNQQIESMINHQKDQYVWDYKRYKRQPDESDLYRLEKDH